MKKILPGLIILLFIFAGNVAYAQTNPQPPTAKEIKKFKRGTFEYMEGLYKGVIIKRTRHRQIETDPATHEKIVLKVKWISDNEFWLIFISDTKPSKVPVKGTVLKVKILSVTADSYTCHWDCEKCGPGGTDSFKKIK
jgi:hypothetical protein